MDTAIEGLSTWLGAARPLSFPLGRCLIVPEEVGGVPQPKPMRYYLSHPWPELYRRGLWVALALILAWAHFGASALTGSDDVGPILFAAAAAGCICGAIRPTHLTLWYVTGWVTTAAFLWRLGQVIFLAAGWTSQEPPDSVAMASAAYMFCSLAVWPVWRCLRPRSAGG